MFGGPISAHAEEPSTSAVCHSPHRAYLRARGGTVDVAAICRLAGLSPRTRRNPAPEPCDEGLWAYLRARGGTVPEEASSAAEGLSPRTRRNPSRHRNEVGDGPISAHAEEPTYTLAYMPGSIGPISAHAEEPPITPSDGPISAHAEEPSGPSQCGPISAHAEEPLHGPCSVIYARAYLRARGGTRRHDSARRLSRRAYLRARGNLSTIASASGLSPRTRRNRPASVRFRAYLRARGGTGSRHRRARRAGPISAHAEEPLPHNPLFPQRNPLFPSKLSKSARPRLTRHDAA